MFMRVGPVLVAIVWLVAGASAQEHLYNTRVVVQVKKGTIDKAGACGCCVAGQDAVQTYTSSMVHQPHRKACAASGLACLHVAQFSGILYQGQPLRPVQCM